MYIYPKIILLSKFHCILMVIFIQEKQMLTALVSQTLRFAKVLETVVKRTKLLENNRLLWNDGMLARVLLYDFMIGPGLYKPGRLKVQKKDIIDQYFGSIKICGGLACFSLISSKGRNFEYSLILAKGNMTL